MELQDAIDDVSTSMATTEEVLTTATGLSAAVARVRLTALRVTYGRLCEQCNELYASLNIPSTFPHLAEYGIDFAIKYVQAFDAKCIARKKATGSFYEYETLDQAVGGGHSALGMYNHSLLVSILTPSEALSCTRRS